MRTATIIGGALGSARGGGGADSGAADAPPSHFSGSDAALQGSRDARSTSPRVVQGPRSVCARRQVRRGVLGRTWAASGGSLIAGDVATSGLESGPAQRRDPRPRLAHDMLACGDGEHAVAAGRPLKCGQCIWRITSASATGVSTCMRMYVLYVYEGVRKTARMGQLYDTFWDRRGYVTSAALKRTRRLCMYAARRCVQVCMLGQDAD